jgi:hypothetical protein
MHGSARLAALVLLSLTACGGPPEAEPQVTLRFERRALLEEASLLALYFYGAGADCSTLRASAPRPPSLLGPFSAELDAASRETGVLLRLEPIPVGEYVVLVDALDLNGRNVGSGCAPGQRVFERQVSAIQLVISDPG